MILVNQQKVERAQEVIDLLIGKKVARTEEEHERKDRFAAHLTTAGIDAGDKEALQFIYEKMGGLVVSEGEAKEMEEKKKAIRKNKKIVS